MQEPKVSIMMLCHTGRGQKLIRAAHSVLAQSYKNWELVIQDDHSTDDTYKIAQTLAEKDERIKLFRNEKNLGAPRNRAEAAKNMTGELWCHVDSDDFIYSDAIATMVLEFEYDPELGYAYSDNAYSDNMGRVYDYQASKDPSPDLSKSGWRSLGMYRKTAYDQTEGYNTRLYKTCEDADLYAQLVQKFRVRRVAKPLYVIDSSGEHLTTSNNLDCSVCPARFNCNYIAMWMEHTSMPIGPLPPLTEQEKQHLEEYHG